MQVMTLIKRVFISYRIKRASDSGAEWHLETEAFLVIEIFSSSRSFCDRHTSLEVRLGPERK
jgi:hypothetical protein